MGEKIEVTKWWALIVLLLLLSIPLFFGLRMAGVFGERVVFEQSFQYKEARKSEIATFEAQLAEIDSRLRSSAITDTVRSQLEAQASAIRIQLSRARAMK